MVVKRRAVTFVGREFAAQSGRRKKLIEEAGARVRGHRLGDELRRDALPGALGGDLRSMGSVTTFKECKDCVTPILDNDQNRSGKCHFLLTNVIWCARERSFKKNRP